MKILPISICPRYNIHYFGYSAISKRDNETEICSSCGLEEALIDAKLMKLNNCEIEFVESLKLEG